MQAGIRTRIPETTPGAPCQITAVLQHNSLSDFPICIVNNLLFQFENIVLQQEQTRLQGHEIQSSSVSSVCCFLWCKASQSSPVCKLCVCVCVSVCSFFMLLAEFLCTRVIAKPLISCCSASLMCGVLLCTSGQLYLEKVLSGRGNYSGSGSGSCRKSVWGCRD